MAIRCINLVSFSQQSDIKEVKITWPDDVSLLPIQTSLGVSNIVTYYNDDCLQLPKIRTRTIVKGKISKEKHYLVR